MNTLDVQHRLEYARAGVAVLRALHIVDKTMRYNEFAKAIGLISDQGQWQAWHQQQVTDILNLIAATEHKAGHNVEIDPLSIGRVVGADGQPGTGYHKTSRIVTE